MKVLIVLFLTVFSFAVFSVEGEEESPETIENMSMLPPNLSQEGELDKQMQEFLRNIENINSFVTSLEEPSQYNPDCNDPNQYTFECLAPLPPSSYTVRCRISGNTPLTNLDVESHRSVQCEIDNGSEQVEVLTYYKVQSYTEDPNIGELKDLNEQLQNFILTGESRNPKDSENAAISDVMFHCVVANLQTVYSGDVGEQVEAGIRVSEVECNGNQYVLAIDESDDNQYVIDGEYYDGSPTIDRSLNSTYAEAQ